MSFLWMVVALTGLALLFVAAPVMALFRAWRRLAALLAAVGVVVAGYGVNKWSGARDEEARVAGFANALDQEEAVKSGVSDAAAWADRKRQEAATKAERDKARQETMARIAAENESTCLSDLKCMAERALPEAEHACFEPVERLAYYSFEWQGGAWNDMFASYRWLDRESRKITYIGDKVRFQNGFGAWQNIIYYCDYDTQAKAVLDVRVSPGRL